MVTRRVDRATQVEIENIARELERATAHLARLSLRNNELAAQLRNGRPEAQRPSEQEPEAPREFVRGDYVRYRSRVGRGGHAYVHHTTEKRVHLVLERDAENYFPRARHNVTLLIAHDAGGPAGQPGRGERAAAN